MLTNYILNQRITKELVQQIDPNYKDTLDSLPNYTEQFGYEVLAVKQWLNCMDFDSRNDVLKVLHLTESKGQ